jgi:hypothetical protein
MASEHSERIVGPQARMLRQESDAQRVLDEANVTQAHVDPAFKSPHVYASYLYELHKRKLIQYTHDCKSYLGVFFVLKKNGTLRTILDTRIVNCLFHDPP